MSYYRTSEVDRIAREVVTEEMVAAALRASPRRSDDPLTRAKVRRNIAIGINCGAYSIVQFQVEQAMRDLVTA
jgi:hypothetical protein